MHKPVSKQAMWISYQQVGHLSTTTGNMSKIKHMFSYSTSTVRQILPVILAGHRQRLPIQALECTYLLGLQAGMETAIYIVSPNHPKGAHDMKHISSHLFFWVIVILVLFADSISLFLTNMILGG